MTTNNRFFAGLSIAEEGECDCLGRLRNGQQFFLANKRNQEPFVKASPKPKNNLNYTNDASLGAYGKRSLKKGREPPFLSPQQKAETSLRHEYYSPGEPHFSSHRRDNRLMEYKELEFRQERPKIQFDFSSSKQTPRLNQKPALAKVSSCQNLPSLNISLGTRMHLPIRHQQTPPSPNYPLSPRIDFRYDSEKFTPLTPRSKPVVVSCRQIELQLQTKVLPPENREHPTLEMLTLTNIRQNPADQLKTQRSIRSVRSKISQGPPNRKDLLVVPTDKVKQMHSVKVIKEMEYSQVQQDPLRSKIEFNNKVKMLDVGRSRIDPKRSGIGDAVGKSRIGGKKAKPGRTALKRINDVDEICSVIDSEQVSQESDKESVVLGRLREYGSVVEPSGVLETPCSESKVGYQSTTAEKSFLRAFESSHFR